MSRSVFFSSLSCCVVLLFSLSSACTKGGGDESFDVQFEVPSSVELLSGTDTMSFRIMFGKAPELSDEIVLAGSGGASLVCPILQIGSRRFTISLPSEISSGVWDVSVRRGSSQKLMGSMSVSVVSGARITPDAGVTVYGMVSCGKEGVEGVVVSDGVEVTVTDAAGVYQLKSAKKYGYVFMSIPSGYEAPSEGVLPMMWKPVDSSMPSSAERKDFELLASSAGDSFTMYILGDVHLANRNSTTADMSQFNTFMYDLKSTMDTVPGKEYVLTLGDMTWDIYWYSNGFAPSAWLSLVNSNFSGTQFFHTMGNHDNDFTKAGDFAKEQTYRDVLCPTFYSYNIGKVHFVVLDDIDYKDVAGNSYDGKGTLIGTDHRGEYSTQIINDQIEWLKKDLAYVPKSTPIVLSTHAPVYRPISSGTAGAYNAGNYRSGLSSSSTSSGTSALASALSGRKVHIFTGHTHKTFNYDAMSSSSGIFEHNAGSVCGDWWWCGKISGINLAQDGAPGGYTVLSVSGDDFKWYYKSTGYPKEYQFRSYDMNEVKKVVTADAGKSAAGYSGKSSTWDGYVTEMASYPDNSVLLNIWDYDPSWTISVTENGTALPVTRIWGNDPLHICAKSMKRLSSFVSDPYNHLFRVQASSSSSTLEIKVTDRFGNTSSETMTRPKAMSVDSYKASSYKSN